MPMIPYSKVKENYPDLPEGVYSCQLKEIEETKAESGNLVWKLIFVVDAGEFIGRYVFDNLVFTDNCYWKHKQLAGAMGLDVSRDAELTQSMILNRKVVLTSFNDEYKGKVTAKVNKYIDSESDEKQHESVNEPDEEDVPF